MLSKNQIKLIQKLQQKKYRSQLGLFVVEGKKSITEFLLSGYQAELIAATTPFSAELSEQPFIRIKEKQQFAKP